MNTASDSGRARRYKDSILAPLRRKNRILYTSTILVGIVYLQWLFRMLDWGHPVAAGFFVLAELICFVCILVWADMLSEERLHPRQTMEWKGKLPDVDLLVTVCNEPMEIVRPTLEAVAKIDYPHLHVMVLDDGHSKEVRELAQKLKFGY
ncbi:MAG: hypothetical protein EBS49_01315, partial [Verrucomicrobia bacterium]|nr:hypothetical protein [Verrucomicrobiota bacterium]